MFHTLNFKAVALALGLALTCFSAADGAGPGRRQTIASGMLRASPRTAKVRPAAPAPIEEELATVEDEISEEPEESAELDESADHDSIDTTRTELIQERFPNGNIRIQRHVTQDADGNYVNHGPWVQYSAAGKKMGAGDYYFGKHHGTWVRWYEPNEGSMFNSTIHKQFQQPFVAEVQLHDGELHGTWTVYDARRLKVSDWHFEHGKRHGKSTWFFPNGQRAREVDYRDGLVDGKSLAWNAQDQLVEDEGYLEGRKLAKTIFWHEPGKKRVEGTIVTQKPIETKYDWWNASITSTNPPDSIADAKSGRWTWWYPNGQKLCEGEYADNLASGKWVFWHANGQKQMEGLYREGQQVGRWTTWAEDGVLLGVEQRERPTSDLEGDLDESAELEDAPPVSADDESDEQSTARIGRLRVPQFRRQAKTVE